MITIKLRALQRDEGLEFQNQDTKSYFSFVSIKLLTISVATVVITLINTQASHAVFVFSRVTLESGGMQILRFCFHTHYLGLAMCMILKNILKCGIK